MDLVTYIAVQFIFSLMFCFANLFFTMFRVQIFVMPFWGSANFLFYKFFTRRLGQTRQYLTSLEPKKSRRMSLAHVALLPLIYSLSSYTSPCFVSDDTVPKPLRKHFNFLLVPKRFQGPRSNFEVDGEGAPLVTQSWGTRNLFLLIIYNFKIIGGHVPPSPPGPLPAVPGLNSLPQTLATSV